jgi:hypothetical protein
MIRAGQHEGRMLEDALDGLAEVFGRPAAATRMGAHFSCAEADRVAWALITSRHPDAAVVWLRGHAASDGEQDLHGGPSFDAIRYIQDGG